MSRIAFESFSVVAPKGWSDITNSLEEVNAPFTIAHPEGVGALQFSIALYSTGLVPDANPTVLMEMVEDFGLRRGLSDPKNIVIEQGPPMLASGTFDWDDDFLRVWQVSDGKNFAFITYTCAASNMGSELTACEKIVRSISF